MDSPDPADRRRPEHPRRPNPGPGTNNTTGRAPGDTGGDRRTPGNSGGGGRPPGNGGGGGRPPGDAGGNGRPPGNGGGGRAPGDGGGEKKGAGGRFDDAGQKLDSAGQKIGSAGKKIGHASKVGAVGFASASKKTAGFTGKVGKATGRRIRGLTGAQGAGESGLSRLIELGAINAAGDTAFAVSLAGTVFFAVPSSQARDRVALFLLLTMAPFALMAPLIGPVLDRFRHGRRWAIGATLGLRGFLVWSLAASISGSSAWLYPAALGCLVASKAYGVTRASAVPRLLPKDVTLVTANSRISLAGLAGATIGAGIAGAFAAIGPQWSLRWAALVYTVGLVLAIRLPTKVDSPAGEEMTGAEGREARRRAITAAVSRGIRCNLGLRFVSGFLTMYLAFLLRDKPISGLNGAVAAGAVIAAAGIGNSLGTLTGSLLKARKPEAVVLVVLFADAIVAICVAVFYGFPLLIALGLVAGLCSSLGKLSLDAMIQRDVPESVRTSVFARSETVLQLAWVIGGGCGILLPLIPRLGFGFMAAVLAIVVFLVIRHKPTPVPPTRGSDHPGPRGPAPHRETRPVPHDPDQTQASSATTRTILSTDPESIAERRTRTPRTDNPSRYSEPTVELRFNPHAENTSDRDPTVTNERDDAGRRRDGEGESGASTRRGGGGDGARDGARGGRGGAGGSTNGARSGGDERPVAGRWWSGQQDDDATVVEEQPWAAEPTLERKAGPFRRRRSGPETGSGIRPPR